MKTERISMATDTTWRLFKREEHVYKNNQFDEILKDAIRFFNGMKVYPLPPPVPFDGAGVYAIYCTARDGIYKKFGETVNRLEYAVPIYVGKAVSAGWRQSRTRRYQLFAEKTIEEQLSSWSGLVGISFGLKGRFEFRACQFDDAKIVNAMHQKLVRKFHPVWNLFFASCVTREAMERRWRLAHSIRFQSKADASMKKKLALLIRAV